jgi:hypothetical protein
MIRRLAFLLAAGLTAGVVIRAGRVKHKTPDHGPESFCVGCRQ